MSTKAQLMTSIRRYIEETDTSGGFWHQDELMDFIDYSVLELWQHWVNNPTDQNPWLIQHFIDNSTASGRTDLRFGTEIITTNIGVTDRILDIYSDSNTVIPRWKVVRTHGAVDQVQFDAALPNENLKVFAIHKPDNLKDIGVGVTGDTLDVPTGWTQWIVKRAIMYAYQKSGQEIRDIKAETDKMLESLINLRYEEGNN